jgi:hypothetical protein
MIDNVASFLSKILIISIFQFLIISGQLLNFCHWARVEIPRPTTNNVCNPEVGI